MIPDEIPVLLADGTTVRMDLEEYVKGVVFGEVGNDHVAELKDIGSRELLFLGLLAVCVLAGAAWLWAARNPAALYSLLQMTKRA